MFKRAFDAAVDYLTAEFAKIRRVGQTAIIVVRQRLQFAEKIAGAGFRSRPREGSMKIKPASSRNPAVGTDEVNTSLRLSPLVQHSHLELDTFGYLAIKCYLEHIERSSARY